MAVSRIKGITIEIDGNAKPLTTALKTVNGNLKDTKAQLNDVNRLLKLDPGNTELLTQKQRLLQEQIGNTEEKLQGLREAQRQAQVQLEKGELGQDRYEALTREIVACEKSLENLTEQARQTDRELKNSTNRLDSIAEAADKVASKTSTLSKGAAALGAAIVGTVPATQEFRRDLSFLEQNAKQAGVSMASAEKAFKVFNSTSGETDSAIEGVSNLLQAGFTKSNLQKAVEGLAGAATRFPDTLKIESLADSLQETLASGKSTGQFAELLDRLGIGAENFDAQLAKCATSAEKQNLALETMAKAGLTDSYKGWKQNNKELVGYENAMLEAQMALSDLATEVAPLVTTVSKGATKMLEVFNSLPKPVKAATGSMVALTAAVSPTASIVSKATTAVATLNNSETALGKTKNVLTGTSGKLFAVLKAHPYALVAAGAAGLAIAIYKGVEAMNAETNAAEKAARTRESAIKSVQAQNRETDMYYQRLTELASVENKTAGQKELMQQYVDRLNQSVEGLNLTYDAENDKLNQTTDAIYKKIEAEKQESIQAAYRKQTQKALEDYAETQIKLADKQTELSQTQEKYNALAEKGSTISYAEAQEKERLRLKVNELQRGVDDLTNASVKYNQEAQKATNLAAMQGAAWQSLVQQAQQAGIEIPQSLITGLEQGKLAVPTTIEELNALISFQTAADNAGVKGQELVNKLTAQISSGQISVTEATKKLTNATTGQLSQGAQTAGEKGSQTGSKYASGIKGTAGSAKAAGDSVALAATQAAASADFYTAGNNAGKGFGKGILGSINFVANAAKTLANQALEAAKKAQKSHSPSKRWENEIGLMGGEGLAIGLEKSMHMVELAGGSLANTALTGATGSNLVQSSDYSSMKSQVKTELNYNKLSGIVKSALSEMSFSIVLDQRELGRGLRGMGVQFR